MDIRSIINPSSISSGISIFHLSNTTSPTLILTNEVSHLFEVCP
jgi:hypothetical protein